MKEAYADGNVNTEHITTDEVEGPTEENTEGIIKRRKYIYVQFRMRPLKVVTTAEDRFPPDFIQKQVWKIERDTGQTNMVGGVAGADQKSHPLNKLHALVSHQGQYKDSADSKQILALENNGKGADYTGEEDKEEEDNNNIINKVSKEARLSPRIFLNPKKVKAREKAQAIAFQQGYMPKEG
ncbi:hypothetical protein KY284_015549 [Solanum tuberosum]|nr:hypothetical protein KY284_015549 [Solanum tuberosum]